MKQLPVDWMLSPGQAVVAPAHTLLLLLLLLPKSLDFEATTTAGNPSCCLTYMKGGLYGCGQLVVIHAVASITGMQIVVVPRVLALVNWYSLNPLEP